MSLILFIQTIITLNTLFIIPNYSPFTHLNETAFSLYNQEEISKSYSRSNSSKEK